MKIGILTFHCAYNFGAVLQCYALTEFLRQQGLDVSVLNYCPDYLETKAPKATIRTFVNRHPRHSLKTFRRYSIYYRTYKRFVSRSFQLTKRVDTLDLYRSVVSNFDIVIIGSDQVWNTKYNGQDPIWYGEGVGQTQKLVAYAVSAGDPHFTPDELVSLQTTLARFSFISVREDCLADVIRPLTPKTITTVLDPSLMAPPETWDKFTPSKERYIVIYQARANDNVFRMAKSLSCQSGCPIIALDNHWNSIYSGYHKMLSPAHFVSVIKNAYCVITTSFHGTAFSLILNTPFYTLRLNDGADARSQSLLQMLNAEDRMVDPDYQISSIDMDFSEINTRLSVLRTQSQEFLLNSLKQ